MERVQELTCYARMTAERGEQLKDMITALDKASLPSYSAPPQWANVLTKDYGDVFWAFSKNQSVDVDCDGDSETLVRGLRQNSTHESYELVLAIADHHSTARPKITLITFDDKKECNIMPDFAVTSGYGDDGQGKECIDRTKINTQNCGNFILSHDQGSGYKLRFIE